jgi:hypothetical protein
MKKFEFSYYSTLFIFDVPIWMLFSQNESIELLYFSLVIVPHGSLEFYREKIELLCFSLVEPKL